MVRRREFCEIASAATIRIDGPLRRGVVPYFLESYADREAFPNWPLTTDH